MSSLPLFLEQRVPFFHFKVMQKSCSLKWLTLLYQVHTAFYEQCLRHVTCLLEEQNVNTTSRRQFDFCFVPCFYNLSTWQININHHKKKTEIRKKKRWNRDHTTLNKLFLGTNILLLIGHFGGKILIL